MTEDMLRLDKQVCFRLYKTSRAMIRLYQPLLEALKITYPQYLTMLVMWEEEEIDFSDLGARLELQTGTLTPVLKKLEEAGYLYREKNTSDNRKVTVVLTREGRTLKKKAVKIPELLVKQVGVTPEQYVKYIEILDELGEVLSIAEKKLKGE